jgi:hypothetical protein
MKTQNNIILIISMSFLIAFAGCKKEDQPTSDPSVHFDSMLKNYQDASSADDSLVAYHQHAQITGIHDSCYNYWNEFHRCDSIYSFHFYAYCRSIYINNGGHNYSGEEWHWDHEGGMMEEHGNWQCGLDTIQYQNWNGSGNYREHDSQMFSWMQGYNMTQHFSDQAYQCYDNMQSRRQSHYNSHNYHW